METILPILLYNFVIIFSEFSYAVFFSSFDVTDYHCSPTSIQFGVHHFSRQVPIVLPRTANTYCWTNNVFTTPPSNPTFSLYAFPPYISCVHPLSAPPPCPGMCVCVTPSLKPEGMTEYRFDRAL